MKRLTILAVAAALLAPAVAFADDADPTLAAFQAICGDAKGDYPTMLKVSSSRGFNDSPISAPADEGVTVTAQAAREATVNGVTLTMVANQGLRHTSKSTFPQTVCEISSNKADPGVLARAQAWLGFAPDSNDQGLAVFYLTTNSGKIVHVVGPTAMQAALDAGGFAFVKVQQDPGATILVYTAYSK